jgi:Fe-S oxidoreductase
MVITEPGCLINLNSALEPLETNLKAVHITEVLAGK